MSECLTLLNILQLVQTICREIFQRAILGMQNEHQTFRLGHAEKKGNFPKTIEHLGINLLLKYALNPQYAKVENEYLVKDHFNIYSCNVCCSFNRWK